MANQTFCIRAQYSADSLQALIQNPTDRSQAIRSAIEAVGGKLQNFFTSGGGDQQGPVVIYEVPDGQANAALINAIIAGNAVRNLTTNRLYTADETVENLRKAQAISKAYEAPGVRRS